MSAQRDDIVAARLYSKTLARFALAHAHNSARDMANANKLIHPSRISSPHVSTDKYCHP
jgi:hypothetical protein